MRMLRQMALIGAYLGFALPAVNRAAPFPQLLPDADSFQLTLREDPASTLPLGPSCEGEASLTLACRAFIVTLKNIGARTVHISRIACQESFVRFEKREQRSSSGWWPISEGPSRSKCSPWTYENLRLRPGESTEYRTRLVSPNRPPNRLITPVIPGSYSVRAHWSIQGCTENPEGADCLAPLQVMKPNSWGGTKTGDVEVQTPVEIVSNDIDASSPDLPDLGPLKIGFEISLASEPEAIEARKQLGARCASDPGTSMECTVFHYAIRNLGERPIRNGRWTCSDLSMVPDYRTDNGEWRHLDSVMWKCLRNFIVETPIMPGEAAEGTLTVAGLSWRFNTSPLYPAGKYEIRFGFQPIACFASPDGSFCIQYPKDQPVGLSNVLSIEATAFTPRAGPVK